MTFDGLKRFLAALGFEQPVTINSSLALHHPDSGTILTLSIPADERTVRPADMLSVEFRLQQLGLIGGRLDDFVTGSTSEF